jgi:predicted hotdog family 3-hydroxylacyl-ACP dehydratase
MKLSREQIARLVPHAGAMCLLDAVHSWDADQISCACAEPGADHPLARGGGVPAIAACEYAAQAAAVHGALLEGLELPRPGMLAKLMDVELHRAQLGGGTLTVRAELLSRSTAGCLYTFDVSGSGERIASGRLMVAFAMPVPP